MHSIGEQGLVIFCRISASLRLVMKRWFFLSMRLDVDVRFFFFQAEDGIRDYKVTGVQTCALPISIAEEIVVAHPGKQHLSAGTSSHNLSAVVAGHGDVHVNGETAGMKRVVQQESKLDRKSVV